MQQTSDQPADRLIRWPAVSQKVPFTRQHIWRLERAGQFPRRVMLGGNSIAWWESEIDAWLRSLPRAPISTSTSEAA